MITEIWESLNGIIADVTGITPERTYSATDNIEDLADGLHILTTFEGVQSELVQSNGSTRIEQDTLIYTIWLVKPNTSGATAEIDAFVDISSNLRNYLPARDVSDNNLTYSIQTADYVNDQPVLIDALQSQSILMAVIGVTVQAYRKRTDEQTGGQNQGVGESTTGPDQGEGGEGAGSITEDPTEDSEVG